MSDACIWVYKYYVVYLCYFPGMGQQVQNWGKQQFQQLVESGRHVCICTFIHQMLTENQDESQMNHLREYSLLGSERCELNCSTIQRVGSGWGTDPSVVTLQSRGAVASQEWPGQDATCSVECFQDWLSTQGTVLEHISPAFPRMGSPASSAAPHLTIMSYAALRTWGFSCSLLVEAQAILCSFSE